MKKIKTLSVLFLAFIFSLGIMFLLPKTAKTSADEISFYSESDKDWNDFVVNHPNPAQQQDFNNPSYSAIATVYNWYTMEESEKLPKYKEDRDFTAIPTIAVTENRWWCAWMIGGDCEPHIENCLAIGYSEDNGLTWEEPVLIVDFVGEDANNARCSDASLMYEDGRLFLFWTQNNKTQTRYQCMYRLEILNHSGAKEEITTTTPTFCTYGNFWKITKLSDGTWAAGIQCNGIKWCGGFYIVSRDYGATWKYRGMADNPAQYSAHNEISVVEKANGVLWQVKRIQWESKQGVEESYSYDGGYTWTDFEFTDYPLKGPGSKFNFIYTNSGNLVFINHDTIEDRKLMTAFISKDKGDTWEESKLLLDERNMVSYPMVDLDKQGNVVVVYDMGRETNREIRIARFNDQDIFAGRIITEGNYIKGLVSIGSDNIDLVSVKENYKEISLIEGASLSVLNNLLPTTVNVTDWYGNEYELIGFWNSSKVDLTKAGVYKANFVSSMGLPENVVDVREILTATVVVSPIKDVKIVSVSGLENKTFTVGTPISDIRKALPSSITVKDENDTEYTVYGYWTSEDYIDEKGEYSFKFNIVSEIPTYVKDVDTLMQVKVTLVGGGCNGNVNVSVILLPLLFGAVLLLKKRGLN